MGSFGGGAPERGNKRLLWLLVALLAADLFFIFLHRLHLQGVLDARFAMDNERGYSELFQHTQELLMAVGAAALLLSTHEIIHACWAGLFGYLCLDDTAQLHEHFGTWLSGMRQAPFFGLSPQSLGEMLISAIVAAAFFGSLFSAWDRTGTAARRFSIRLMAGLAALGFVGVAVDAVHSLVRLDPWRYRLGIIEEGGELLVVSVMTWMVLREAMSSRSPARIRLAARRWYRTGHNVAPHERGAPR